MAAKSLGVNPWINIWVKPRETIRKIVKFNPRYRFVILSFIYALPMLLHTAQNLNLGQTYTTLGIVAVACVFATFIGMLALTLGSWLIHWTGKWIGGKASFLTIRSAVAWSNVPNVLSIVIWGLLIYGFKEQTFLDGFEEIPFFGKQAVLISTVLFAQAVLAIWSFVILVKGLGEVQGFSAWKGVLNVLIPFFLVGILIWAVSWVFWIIKGMPGA